MSDFGIKVSKQGFDAVSTEPKNLIFDSTKNQLKVAKVLEKDFVATATSQVFSASHGLSYIPGFIPYLRIDNKWYGNVGEDPVYGNTWQFYADKTNIYLDVSVTTINQKFRIKVYILVDGASNVTSDTQTDNAFGMGVSKPKVDVLKASDQGLSFSSGFVEALQIFDIKTITAVNEELSVSHGLDYTPAWMAVAIDKNFDDLTFLLPSLLIGSREIMVWSDKQNINVRIESIDVQLIQFKIIIFNNKLE